MRIGSLFSGIGGLELGLEWSGIGRTVWQVERDEYCRRVLARHWPDVARFDDVCAVGASTLAPVDLICGGFPCQDISSAGKGAGLAGSRSGLWFEFQRIIRELGPEWVVIENVASGGNRWIDAVTGHLGELGYGSIPFPMSAFDVGAPHLRKRIFVVAHAAPLAPRSDSGPQGNANVADSISEPLREQQGRSGRQSREGAPKSPHDGGTRVASDSDSDSEPALAGHAEVARVPKHRIDSPVWPALPELRRVDDGLPNRLDRNRALGNAVVPQCAEVVGWVIREVINGGKLA